MTGEEGLLPGTARRTGARAGEDSVVIPLEGSGVNRALRTASKTYGAFIASKEEELALARALSGPRRAGGATRQLGALLLHLSGRLGRVEEKKGVRIPIRLPHRVLADLAGCHRSTVTTILNDWIYAGILTQKDGRFLILDPESLASSDPGPATVSSVDPK
jgi:CRP-like cAMP-binding protein